MQKKKICHLDWNDLSKASRSNRTSVWLGPPLGLTRPILNESRAESTPRQRVSTHTPQLTALTCDRDKGSISSPKILYSPKNSPRNPLLVHVNKISTQPVSRQFLPEILRVGHRNDPSQGSEMLALVKMGLPISSMPSIVPFHFHTVPVHPASLVIRRLYSTASGPTCD